MLDRLYQQFDALSRSNEVFKVRSLSPTALPNQRTTTLHQHHQQPFGTLLSTCAISSSEREWISSQVETIGDAWMGVTNLVEDQVERL